MEVQSLAAEVVEMKVSCGWARGCNTGHGSCLSLPLVSCVAASGTAALSTSETGRDHHIITGASCQIISHLIFF
ncbi:hypothetical protein R3I94_019129 [Phoxinus phoxinus]|uniref:Uncharacterized protein n=1 Tax=Phoxinus phoxinus TaxID=58324 RepID=A0AAN9CJ21_9TELE